MAYTDYLGELRDASRQLSTSKLSNLSELTPEEIDEFAEVWGDVAVERRRTIIQRLVELTEDNVDLDFSAVYLYALDADDSEIRVRAMRGLWEYEGGDFLRQLLHLLRNDPDPGVRAEAAFALGRFELLAEFGSLSERDIEELDSALRAVIADPDEPLEVRARAIEAVGSRGEPWVIAIIRAAYEGNNDRLKVSSIEAMGRTCDSQWLPTLIEELQNEEPEFRFEAADALGEIGDEAAVPHLLPLLQDEDAEVQESVIAALGEIGGRRSRTALQRLSQHPEERVRDAAKTAMEHVDFSDDPLKMRFDQ